MKDEKLVLALMIAVLLVVQGMLVRDSHCMKKSPDQNQKSRKYWVKKIVLCYNQNINGSYVPILEEKI